MLQYIFISETFFCHLHCSLLTHSHTMTCYETLFDKMMSNIKEVKARGARILAVALEGNKEIYEEADDVLLVPRTEPVLNAIAEVIPLQLYAYYVAKNNECNIDRPKNLAKSVTVE